MWLQLNTIKARGESTNDIMVDLFKGYKNVTDGQFKHYIVQKNKQVQQRRPNHWDKTDDTENKYNSGEWQAPTEDQQELVALKTKRNS